MIKETYHTYSKRQIVKQIVIINANSNLIVKINYKKQKSQVL